MTTVANFPYWEIQFTADGEPDAHDRQLALDEIEEQSATDLLVLSHGWRNDVDDARALYKALLTSMRARLDAAPPATGTAIAALAVLWPSMEFADPDELPNAEAQAAAAIGDSTDVPPSAVADKLDELAVFLGAQGHPELATAREAAEQIGGPPLPDGSDPRAILVSFLKDVLPRPSDPNDDRSDLLFGKNADELFNDLAEPVSIVDTRQSGGAASFDIAPAAIDAGLTGEAAGLGSLFSGVRAAAWRILNYATYYAMKERAGKVGTGLNGVLGDLRARCPSLRIHLVGHSFGARLVTAAAAGPAHFSPASLSLLQGAYSHNGLGPGIEGAPIGYFRPVIADSRVNGPIIATHTQNDKAVGIAYAIASRLSGDEAAAFGGPDDLFGGIGRNGAVRMLPSETIESTLLDGSSAYPPWPSGKVVNLLADNYISGHPDVTNPAVANAVLHAAGL